MEFAEQDKRLYIAVYDKLSQGLRDRVDNTHSFNQNHPKITIQGGVQKHRGLDLIYSLVFTHMESHGALESRIRASIYSYHLALKSQPLLELVERIRGDLALARKHAVRLSWTESGSKWYSVVSSRSIILGNAMAPFGPQGERRKDMLDPQDCLQTLFELADVIENSTLLAEQAEGTTVGAAFHVRHPAIREAWGSATNPHHSSSQAANNAGGNRWRPASAKGGKGFGKGKGKDRGKGKSRSINAQFNAPRDAPIRRCPALGCTELLTTRKMRVVCDGCYKKSLVNPVPLTQNRTFPERRPSEGKGGKSRGSPYGKGKTNPPRMHFRDAQRQAHGVDVASPQARHAMQNLVTSPQGGLQGAPCHDLEALGASHIPPPEIPYADTETAEPISLQEVNRDHVRRAQGQRDSLESNEDTDSPTANIPLNVFAATYNTGDSNGAFSPNSRADGISPSGIPTTPPGSPPATPPPIRFAGAGMEQERKALLSTTRLELDSPSPRKCRKRGWDVSVVPPFTIASPNGSMQTHPGDDAAHPHGMMQVTQGEPNPDPNPDPNPHTNPDPDPDSTTRLRAGTRAGEQAEAGVMVGTQGPRKHSSECEHSTVDPDPTLSQVYPVHTQAAAPALDQVSGTSTCTRGAGVGKSVDDSSDEMPQGEVVYDVPSVADILLLLQRSTPPMHLRHGSAHSVAMPPTSQCGVGGNATAISPREVMSVQVHAGSKSAPAPPHPQPQHTSSTPDTYLPRAAQCVPQGDSCLPWADTPQEIPTADMVLPQYAPSFTKGSTLSSSEALLRLHAG